jgi:transcriptional regulator with XRE-family HTH domain
METIPGAELRIGDRIRYHRERAGLTQLAVAAQVGRSEDWLSKIERGIVPVDKFSMILQLAEVLGVRDLADLTGHRLNLAATDTPRHASVAAIRAAMNSLPATRGDRLGGSPWTAAALERRVSEAWSIYDGDKARYARLGPELPELLGHAHRTARTAVGDADALLARRSLISVHHLLQVYLKRLGERELAHVAADRALAMATELGDLEWMAASAWNLGAIMLNRGEGDLALELSREMIAMMTPIPEDASPEYVSVYGALHLVAVIACARSGQSGRGWDYLRQAELVAQRLGADRNDFRTSFGPTNVAMHAVHLAGEEGDPTEALRLADQVDVDAVAGILPLERTTRYLIEVMQANRIAGDDLGTLYMLQKIERQSPEEIKHFPTAREGVRDLIRRGRPIYRREVEALAARMGVIV